MAPHRRERAGTAAERPVAAPAACPDLLVSDVRKVEAGWVLSESLEDPVSLEVLRRRCESGRGYGQAEMSKGPCVVTSSMWLTDAS